MNVGILGSGSVGQQLGLGLAKLGHQVKIGTRDAGRLKDWLAAAGTGGSAGTFEEAARFGEVVALATLWAGTQNALKMAGEGNLAGKVVIDVTNPLDFSKGAPPGFAATVGNSAGEQVQRWLPRSKVVKAFNTIGAAIMTSPKREGGMPDLFIAGNDAGAKKLVGSLAEGFGWPGVVDMGDIQQAFWLEALAMLWIQYGFKNNNWTHAFKLLRN